MRSGLVAVIMVLIAVAFTVAAYYYWHGGSRSGSAIAGVVIDKFQREAGTEAGEKTLEQGLNLLTGKSLTKEVFYFVRVKTEEGEEIDIEVPRDLFLKVRSGDTVRRSSPDADPTIIRGSDRP